MTRKGKGNPKGNPKSQVRSGGRRRKTQTLYVAVIAGLGIALVLVLTLGNRQGGASAEQVAGATGILSPAEGFHNFGSVSMRDGKVNYGFAVRNESGAPALVAQVYTSCMCTEASLLVGDESLGPFGMQGHGYTPRISQVIPAGQEAVVKAVFDPNAHGPAGIGRNNRSISLVMGGGQTLELKFTAYVTP